jgi:hypothetical protein
MINAYVNLEFKLGDQKFKEHLNVTGLGKQRIILEFPWLHKYNPIINWKKGGITFKPFQIDWRRLMEKGKRIQQKQQPKIEEVVDDENQKTERPSHLKKTKWESILNYWRQMYGSTKPTSQWSLLLKKIVRKQTKWTNNWYQQNITNIWTSSAKKRHTVFLNQDLGNGDTTSKDQDT